MINNAEGSENNDVESSGNLNVKDSEGIIQFKIVYWGPGESGKTTNFMRLREKFNSITLTEGYSIETTEGRTLWQDSLFISFNFKVKGVKYTIITQIVTCTGQERFLSTREYVLDGADGIVFVGDSLPEKSEQNKRSFRELISFAKPKEIPYIVQLNKRDLENAVSIDGFKKDLGLPIEEKYQDGTFVVYPAMALQGKNVINCFQDLLVQVIFNYFNS
ncbi:MAG: ATP/GTP-binding protein [Promethearchaeota archaeon]